MKQEVTNDLLREAQDVLSEAMTHKLSKKQRERAKINYPDDNIMTRIGPPLNNIIGDVEGKIKRMQDDVKFFMNDEESKNTFFADGGRGQVLLYNIELGEQMLETLNKLKTKVDKK